MSLKDKTKSELIAIIEKDRDVVKRARQAHTDLAHEMERRVAAEKEVERLKALPPKEVVREVIKKVPHRVEVEKEVIRRVPERVEVPVERTVCVEVPDPKTIAENERLREKLAAIPKDDIRLAKRWREIVEKQNGNH